MVAATKTRSLTGCPKPSLINRTGKRSLPVDDRLCLGQRASDNTPGISVTRNRVSQRSTLPRVWQRIFRRNHHWLDPCLVSPTDWLPVQWLRVPWCTGSKVNSMPLVILLQSKRLRHTGGLRYAVSETQEVNRLSRQDRLTQASGLAQACGLGAADSRMLHHVGRGGVSRFRRGLRLRRIRLSMANDRWGIGQSAARKRLAI